MNEMPTMYCSSRVGTAYEGGMIGGKISNDLRDLDEHAYRGLLNFNQQLHAGAQRGLNQFQEPKPMKENSMKKRIVQVFIADPDTRVPVENSLLHRGEEKMTDLTDQELFYEIQITSVLEKHNAYRTTVVDKQASARAGKEIFLDAIKIRDLAMNVVTIATF